MFFLPRKELQRYTDSSSDSRRKLPSQETKKLAEDSTAACAAAKQVGWPRWWLPTICFSSISSKVDDDCSYTDNIYIYIEYKYMIAVNLYFDIIYIYASNHQVTVLFSGL